LRRPHGSSSRDACTRAARRRAAHRPVHAGRRADELPHVRRRSRRRRHQGHGRSPSPPRRRKPAAAAKPVVSDEDAPAVDAKGEQIRGADGKFVSKRQQAINERIRESVERGTAAERERADRLERELADLKRGAQPAKPAEAPPPADAGPAEPDFEKDFESQVGTKYDSYGKAVQAFNRAYHQWTKDTEAHAAKATQAKEAETATARAAETRIQTFLERETAFAAAHPEYDAATRDLRAQLNPDMPLTQALLESEHAPALIHHFAQHPDDLTRIGVLGQTNLPAALRAIGKLEATFDTAGASPATTPALPTRKTVSDAPAPPTTLGTRSAEPADQKEAAIKRKDVAAYFREADREALAVVRR
jgi:hypothetical protein